MVLWLTIVTVLRITITGPRNKGTTSYYDIATEEEGTPPPPYSPRNYAVFITDSSARPSCVTPGRSAAGQLAGTYNNDYFGVVTVNTVVP